MAEENSTSPEKVKTIRGKWLFDGATSIEEMAEQLEEKAAYLRELDDGGWELSDTEVRADYAHLSPPDSES